jgi:hypothetical protein
MQQPISGWANYCGIRPHHATSPERHTHQKIARGRLGSNLRPSATSRGGPQIQPPDRRTADVRDLAVPPEVLKLVPYRLADQFTVLPISVKEPKSLSTRHVRSLGPECRGQRPVCFGPAHPAGGGLP